MKRLVLLIFVLMISTTPVLAQDIFEQESYWQSVAEIMNLNVDGSGSTILVNSTKDMDYIGTMTFYLSFTVVDLDWDKFGKGNGTDTLVNGLYLIRGGVRDPFLVKSNKDFLGFGRDTTVYKDEKTVGSYMIVIPINYYEFMEPYGLTVVKNINVPYLMFGVQDNIPLYVDGLHVVISGRKWIQLEPEFERDWVEDQFIIDSPIKLITAPFVLPFLLIFTWEASGIVIGAGLLLVEILILRLVWVRLRF